MSFNQKEGLATDALCRRATARVTAVGAAEGTEPELAVVQEQLRGVAVGVGLLEHKCELSGLTLQGEASHLGNEGRAAGPLRWLGARPGLGRVGGSVRASKLRRDGHVLDGTAADGCGEVRLKDLGGWSCSS